MSFIFLIIRSCASHGFPIGSGSTGGVGLTTGGSGIGSGVGSGVGKAYGTLNAKQIKMITMYASDKKQLSKNNFIEFVCSLYV